MPDASDYLRAITDESAALLAAAQRAGLDAPVPSCPGWDVAELLGHIGGVQRWAAEMSQLQPDAERLPRDRNAIPARDARPGWFRAVTDELVRALDRPVDTPAWTWIPPATVGFWQRRQAHEAAMHRVDAELAAGLDAPRIDAELAADGIDEFLAVVKAFSNPRLAGQGETLHFHCTDVDGEWLARMDADGVTITREHAKGDVAAKGSASDLLCWMQGRGPVEVLEVFGDAPLLDRWRSETAWG
ncbi:MAG TPA: maleylpyruvate isomerase family mycothiol-dependent enzyme [Acidimicrobiia bacterium]|nr:maleylpyruvate isomerase family mycothiol-dependent enzyme [Acidimicrobiia bacterium]